MVPGTSRLEGHPGRSYFAAPVGLKTLLGVLCLRTWLISGAPHTAADFLSYFRCANCSPFTCQAHHTRHFSYIFLFDSHHTISNSEFSIMPNTLTMFKGDPTLRASWLQSYDALAIAIQDNLFHHFEEENVQACADGHFGVVDCFQWPQAYDNIFCNSVCIPRKEVYLFPHPLHWAWYTPKQKDFKTIPGNSFPVGTLASDKVEGLESLLKLVEKRVQDWRANRQVKKDVIINCVISLRHGILRLKKHPLTFRDLLIFVMDAQCLFLEIHSFMDWVLIAQPRISSGIGTVIVNSEWMGAFMHDSDMCNKLHMAEYK
ncbi:uncharacterized protein F5891DRAFT_1190791 [Suillus fuscotomentosus]|uniref:Uncharacterized protein n=1 Tax=Suillus fuscotomentosus TaxID=1912939 RepID=A0AAD4HI15_9AGAM|nr:uncharacterized protein F5891DRAFT_1190791 [Suillus fuscotomentosus]KAG1898410.1 hypothetical protein F5891DRAFT_1190791 [Suillus fuscotomentosus]